MKRNYRKLIDLVMAVLFCCGAAFADEPILALMDSVSVVDFGRQNVDAVGAARSLTITNTSATELTVLSVRLTGANPDEFTIANDFCTGATLTSANTCTMTVNFLSSGTGVRSARLSFQTTASALPVDLPISGYGVDPARPMRMVGPVDLRHNFPVWYQDESGLRLALCLDATGMCINSLPDPASPPSVADASINFPGEAFWWYAEAKINRLSGGKVVLVLSKEAAFMNGRPVVGEQIAFDRIRIRIDRLVAGQTYRVTHPFGVTTLVANNKGEINTTEDIGCLSIPCNFQNSMNSSLRTFLRWDPAIGPQPPVGYIGDPNVGHAVVGSPLGTNFFKVEGPNVGGNNINVVQTALFNVQGKIY